MKDQPHSKLLIIITYRQLQDSYSDIMSTNPKRIYRVMQIPPIAAVLGGFGSAQCVSLDFPECNTNGHSVKDILGKNILQFGFVLSELMKNFHNSEDFQEV